MIVLDTNVLSEIPRPSPSVKVINWVAALEPLELFLTAVTQAELLYGVEALPAGKRRTSLHEALEKLFSEDFNGRILPFDAEAARWYAKIVRARQQAERPISQMDAMIVSIARAHGGALATRNIRDFEHCGVRLVNPWNE